MTTTQTDRFNGLVGSQAIKLPIRVYTATSLTLSGLQTIQGVSVVEGDRVGMFNNTVNAGIYVVSTSTWQRAADFNGSFDATQGTVFQVLEGAYANKWFQVTNTGTIIVGTTIITVVEKVFIGSDVIQESTRIRVPSYVPSSAGFVATLLEGSVTPTFGHRHFGGITRTKTGRLLIAYRKSPSHGSQQNTETCYFYSDADGRTGSWSSEAILNAGQIGRDNASALVGTSETGRVFIAWADIDSVTGDVNSGNPQIFKLRYSDDDGNSWSDSVIIDTSDDHYARLFGSLKSVPSDEVDGETMLICCAYRRTSTSPNTYASMYYKSYDDGINWSDPVYIVNNTTGYNECDVVYANDGSIIAACRGPNGVEIFVSVDGGANFTNKGIVPGTTSDSYVAPSLDILYENSMEYVLLGFCDRVLNETVWITAPVNNAFGSLGADDFNVPFVTGTDDMVNASGYQRVVIYPTGHAAFVEFKEYTGGLVYSDVRFGQFSPYRWLKRYWDNKLILGTGADLDCNARLNVQVDGANATAIGTDAGSDAERHHWSMTVNDADGGYIGTLAANMIFGANGEDPSLFIQGNGNVYVPVPFSTLLGMSTEYANDATLHITGQASTIAAITSRHESATSRPHHYFENPNGLVGSITTSGSATAYNTSSDPRLKSEFEEVDDIEVAETIAALSTCIGKFTFKADESKVPQVGFNAHKVIDLAVCDYLGTEGNGPRDMAIGDVYDYFERERGVIKQVDTGKKDEKGNIIYEKVRDVVTELCEMKVTPAGVDPSKAVPLLILAVDMLMRRCSELEDIVSKRGEND